MNVHFYLDNGHGGLGKNMGNTHMPIPPRIGEAVFVPGSMTHKRVVDVFWQPDDAFDACGDNIGTKTWANVIVKYDP